MLTVQPTRMRDDLDLSEDAFLDADDPVVRMPKSMAAPLPEPPGVGARTVLAIALLGALLGAALGAMGIGIVYATRLEVAPAVGHARFARRHRRATDAVAGVSVPATGAPSGAVAPVTTETLGVTGTQDGGVGMASGSTGDPAVEFETAQQSVGRGRTLSVVFRALAVPADEAGKATRALRGYVNLRALQPADRVVALRDATSHALRRVEYRRSPTQVFAAVRSDDGTWQGERVEAVMATVRTAAGFRVQGGSVETSVRAAGLHPEIIPRLAEAFPAIDLPDHLNGGDVIRFVVDEDRLNGAFYRYGRVYGLDYHGAMGHRRAYQVRLGTLARAGGWFDAQGQTWARGPLRSPVPGARISSRFDPHRMHPVLHVIKAHNGMDFAAPTGTPVYSAAEGTVVSVGPAGPSGNLVRLRHPGLGVETGYAHLSRFAPGLRAGQRVRVRQLVGYVGTTGRSTGAHLHFSVRRNGRFIDPETLYGGRRGLTGPARADFDRAATAVGAELDGVTVDGASLRPDTVGAPGRDGGTDGGTDGGVAPGTPGEAPARGSSPADPADPPALDDGTEGTPEDDGEGEGEVLQ